LYPEDACNSIDVGNVFHREDGAILSMEPPHMYNFMISML
jgi:hypothetical protein